MTVPHFEAVLLLTDVVQRLADKMARDSSMSTREDWSAHELLVAAAAHLRGAAQQLAARPE